MSEERPDSGRMPTLAELLQQLLDGGMSYRTIAKDTGDRITHQMVENWHKDNVHGFPREVKTFEGFARVLGIAPRQVLMAMARQLNVPVGADEHVAGILPPGAGRLTFEQRRALRVLVRGIVGEPEQQPSTSTTDRQEDAPAIGVLHAADSRQKTRPKAPKRGQQ